jgi:prepilin-type processing-associated H-X9-DG protein
VRWGHEVNGTCGLGEGRHEVMLADGSTAVSNLLVGADGARSRVRPLRSGATPAYVGTSFVETYLFDAETRHTGASEVVGPGAALLGDAAHLAAPNGGGANLAMLDGAGLGKALAVHPDDIEAALTEYEQALPALRPRFQGE